VAGESTELESLPHSQKASAQQISVRVCDQKGRLHFTDKVYRANLFDCLKIERAAETVESLMQPREETHERIQKYQWICTTELSLLTGSVDESLLRSRSAKAFLRILLHHLPYLRENVVDGWVVGQESDLELRRIFDQLLHVPPSGPNDRDHHWNVTDANADVLLGIGVKVEADRAARTISPGLIVFRAEAQAGKNWRR